MRIAHVAICTPRRCGLYETTRELVVAERGLGVDARLVDPKPHPTVGVTGQDRGVPIADWDWAVGADLVVSHSGHDGTPISDTKQPIVHVSHGRPVSTFLGERAGQAPAYSYALDRRRDERYRMVLTFWPEYEPVLRVLWAPKPVVAITPPCDTGWWSPGASDYDWAGAGGRVNVVMTDPWSREDVCPITVVHAFALFRSIVPGARLHIYAWDGNSRGVSAIKGLLGGSLGVVQRWASDLRSVYRKADLLITPHRIYTRAIREAMSCGCQVVSGRDVEPEDTEAFALKMASRLESRLPMRGMAEALFNPHMAAKEFLAAVEREVVVPCGD